MKLFRKMKLVPDSSQAEVQKKLHIPNRKRSVIKSLRSRAKYNQTPDDLQLNNDRAREVYRYIKPHVKTTGKNELIMDGRVITNSNLTELINNSINFKKNVRGWQPFLQLLRRTGFPPVLSDRVKTKLNKPIKWETVQFR